MTSRGKKIHIVHEHVRTWMRERMLAKCWSMAPPCGKLALIRLIKREKQLYAFTSAADVMNLHVMM